MGGERKVGLANEKCISGSPFTLLIPACPKMRDQTNPLFTPELADMEWKADDWPQDFKWSESAASVLKLIDQYFSAVARPQRFTNVHHCSECRAHDDELSVRPRMELRRSDLGGPGWDPINFTSPQGVAYLMPALARYAMAPDFWPNLGWYADQMALHLVLDGNNNRLVTFCSPEQRTAISLMISWMIENRAGDLDRYALEDQWLRAFDVWQPERQTNEADERPVSGK